MEKTADKIINFVGGKNNISYFARCMSRLRFEFKDLMKVDLTELKKMREILSIVRCGEEVCFVIKKGLPYLYTSISEKIEKGKEGKQKKGFLRYIKCYGYILLLSGILCVASFLMGIKSIVVVSFFITSILSFSAGVTADVLLGFIKWKDDMEGDSGIDIISPLKGRIISENGKGFIRIYPHINIAVAPVDGVVEDIMEHAFLIRSFMGFGVFVHIGIDTINMGRCFKVYAKRGDMVKRGDIIVEFDGEKLTKEGYSLLSYAEVLDYDERWKLSVLNGYATGGRGFAKLSEK